MPIPNKQDRAFAENLTTFDIWLEHLTLLAVSSITWKLPKTVDPLYIERELFYNGKVIFFIADNSLVGLGGFGASKPNPYGIPLKRIVNARNGFTAELTNDNSVIIYNNALKKPGINIATQYAYRLAQLDRIIDLNAYAQKTPYIFRSTKEAELSVRNAFAAFDNSEPAVFVSDDFKENAISVFNLNPAFTASQIRALQENILSEYLRTLGIGGANTNKAERLISSEVAASNSGLFVYQQARIKPRQLGCEEINNMFGAYLEEPVSVKFNADVIDYVVKDVFGGNQNADIKTTEEVSGDE